MTDNGSQSKSNGWTGVKRRTVLGTVAAGGAALGGVGVVGGESGNEGGESNGHGKGRDEEEDDDGGFPPSGTTEYGRVAELGDGEVRPSTTETPSGEPNYHGVEFERDALAELPGADDPSDDTIVVALQDFEQV
jgi:hypothetical protein